MRSAACSSSKFADTALQSSRSFSSSSIQQTQRAPVIKKRRRDAYAMAQTKARKAANQSRQQVLLQTRAVDLGDPIRGIETDFVRSFDAPPVEKQFNFFVSDVELQQSIERSTWLNTPTEEEVSAKENAKGLEAGAKIRERISDTKERAKEALQRISSLELGSSKDRLRVNVQRCISAFGRHETDKILPRKPSPANFDPPTITTTRAGPDTGSSEVQIGVLTARIRALATNLEARGSQDKDNKRRLRILVHRRQKLLQYLRRKERAGPRWQHCISTLGLTEGTWRGEISLR